MAMTSTPTEQIADLVSALSKIAWPIAIVVLAIRFRPQISSLIGGIRRATGAGFEFEFQEQTREVLDDLSGSGLQIGPAEQKLIGELSKTNPRLAINLAWARVRDSSSRAGVAVGVGSRSTVRRIERLGQKGFATEEIVNLARTLGAMESAVLSQPNVDPPRDFADAFSVAALSLARWLEDSVPGARQARWDSPYQLGGYYPPYEPGGYYPDSPRGPNASPYLVGGYYPASPPDAGESPPVTSYEATPDPKTREEYAPADDDQVES
jgi:hypothetical protein